MDSDRPYVLRTRPDGASEDDYVPINVFDVEKYRCGLAAGDKVKLRVDIPVRDSEGQPTGGVHSAGEIWTVLSGSSQDPDALWFRQSDGELHSWDDDPSIYDTFEKMD